jgi:hypothetical protein
MQLKPITAIAVLLLVVASLSVAGCTNNQNQTRETQTTAAPSSAPSQVPTARPAQVIVSAQYQGGYVSPDYYAGPKPGYEYVKYYATVTNINRVGPINPLYFTLIDSANGSYPLSYATFTATDYLKGVQKSQPGDTSAGIVIFEIPQGATPQKLVYNDYSNNVTVTV